VSDTVLPHLGWRAADLLGQSLALLLPGDQLEAVQQGLTTQSGQVSTLDLTVPINGEDHPFEGRIHRIPDAVILELLPVLQPTEHYWQIHNWLQGSITRLQQAGDLTEFLQSIPEVLLPLIGFDRVMIYQFDHQGAGSVVAESKQQTVETAYLGLHYPASDIPEESREMYRLAALRYIPDVTAAPSQLIPTLHPITQQPVDLSRAILRSMDACPVIFLQNMGVAAFMVIGLYHNQQLWGLISCHHATPKFLSAQIRSACERFGQIVSLELANKALQQEMLYATKLETLRAEVVASISQADTLQNALIKPASRLLDLVGAQGAAVCLGEEITPLGSTPTLEQMRELLAWAETQGQDLFHTDALAQHYPEAQAFQEIASGLLLLPISRVRHYYLLWFRPEVIQTVNWAGDPHESIHIQPDGSVILCPRQSFALWQEIVRGTALPWRTCELESALDLRSAIVGIVLKQADELTRINQELERSNQELASFAYAASHDLKEPLRGIHNYAVFLQEDYTDVLDEAGLERLSTLVNLTQRMENLIDVLLRFSQLGQTQLHLQWTDLNELVARIAEMFQASSRQPFSIRVPHPLPRIRCDAVLVSEVFTNLISNGLKYNDQAEKWVEIGYREPVDAAQTAAICFTVQDNGIGIRERHQDTIFRLFKRLHPQNKYGGGTGAGLTIAKKIVERHGGRIWVESTVGQGSTFCFTLT
jgi:light-regulated signal transduction histidine kinase (bacteriophytochrome)